MLVNLTFDLTFLYFCMIAFYIILLPDFFSSFDYVTTLTRQCSHSWSFEFLLEQSWTYLSNSLRHYNRITDPFRQSNQRRNYRSPFR